MSIEMQETAGNCTAVAQAQVITGDGPLPNLLAWAVQRFEHCQEVRSWGLSGEAQQTSMWLALFNWAEAAYDEDGRYAEIEREHLGDIDKGTGIYARKANNE